MEEVLRGIRQRGWVPRDDLPLADRTEDRRVYQAQLNLNLRIVDNPPESFAALIFLLRSLAYNPRPKRAAMQQEFFATELPIGLDLGDRSSWYCMLEEQGEVVLERKLGATPKAMKEVFGGMPRSRIALEPGMHSPWVSRVLGELVHEVIVAHARNVRLIGESRKKDDRLRNQSPPPRKEKCDHGRSGRRAETIPHGPPVDGKANTACIDFLAKILNLPRSSVTIAAGQTSRKKVIRVAGLSAEKVRQRLNI